MRDSSGVLNAGRCADCGKANYETRAKAKKGAKVFHPDNPMRPYKCGQFWHIGHLSSSRRRGQLYVGDAPR